MNFYTEKMFDYMNEESDIDCIMFCFGFKDTAKVLNGEVD
jgi:hypothetical protein